MTLVDDNERIIEEAVAALPEIAAAQLIHRAWFTWRYDAPLEPLEESRYLELTRKEGTDVIKVPCGRST